MKPSLFLFLCFSLAHHIALADDSGQRTISAAGMSIKSGINVSSVAEDIPSTTGQEEKIVSLTFDRKDLSEDESDRNYCIGRRDLEPPVRVGSATSLSMAISAEEPQTAFLGIAVVDEAGNVFEGGKSCTLEQDVTEVVIPMEKFVCRAKKDLSLNPTSLLVAIGIYGRAPQGRVFVHNFKFLE